MALEELLNKIKAQLDSGDTRVNQTLVNEAKAYMASNPESRKAIGPFIGQLNSVSKYKLDEALDWLELLNGAIAVGHRPKVKSMMGMKGAGTTHILTLLSEKEGAKEIGNATKKCGLNWIWLPLQSAEPPAKERFDEIDSVFRNCIDALKTGAKIYIHCSAGIHRTGMIAYALFRYVGFDSEKASAKLSELREVTGKEVGEERKAWGDELFS